MFLNKIAQHRMDETFLPYYPDTMEFGPDTFAGRIELTDRFLSIYNRPIRKRQLFSDPNEKLPESLVCKHVTTGQVYILGQVREDARGDVTEGNPYVSMSMMHNVTPNPKGSSGLAQQMRKIVMGPPEDPGWLVEQEISRDYLDIEFRTSSSEEGLYNSKIANFYAWTTLNITAKQWDYFYLNDRRLRVVDSFTDMGMRGLRLDEESDPRVDVVIVVKERDYNTATHAFEEVEKEYNITVIVPKADELAGWALSDRTSSAIEVVVEFNHIGFKPLPNMTIKYQGRSRLVKNVYTQAGEQQYRLTCE